MNKNNPNLLAQIEQTRIAANIAQYKAFYKALPLRLIELMIEAEAVGVRYSTYRYKNLGAPEKVVGIPHVVFYRLNDNEEEELTVSLEDLEYTITTPATPGNSFIHQIDDFEQIIDFLNDEKAKKLKNDIQQKLVYQSLNKLNDDELTALKTHFRSMPT